MNETVIITGHSHGLGAALAAAWLQCDARVLGIARGDNPALAAAYPHTLQEIPCDLANPVAVLAPPSAAFAPKRGVYGSSTTPAPLLHPPRLAARMTNKSRPPSTSTSPPPSCSVTP